MSHQHKLLSRSSEAKRGPNALPLVGAFDFQTNHSTFEFYPDRTRLAFVRKYLNSLFVCVAKLCYYNMCEKRTRKIKKGSQLTRMREARRIQRMRRVSTPPSSDESVPAPFPPVVDKALQNRVILELACKTIALMHKNRLIQEKIIALQKETSEFVATIMKHPENRRRYIEHVRLYGVPQRLQLQVDEANQNPPLKVEPDA